MDNYWRFKYEYVYGNKFIYITGVNEVGVTEVGWMQGDFRIVSGMAYAILQDLVLMLNFTVKYLPANNYFQDPDVVNPPFNSSISYQLTDGQADIAVGYFYYVITRLKYGKPMVPLSFEMFQAYYHKPQNAFRNVFQEPFSPNLALTFVIMMCLIGLSAMFQIERRSIGWKIQEGVTWALAAISQQGFALQLPTISVRILICVGALLSFLLNAYYSAAILAFLTVDNKVMTYDHLLNYGYSMYANRSSNSTLLHYNKKNSKAILKTPYMDYDESILKLFRKNHDHTHAHLDTMQLFSLKLKTLNISAQLACDTISWALFPGEKLKAGFYMRKDFRYRSLFNSRLLKVKEVGLSKRYLTIYTITTIEVLQCPKKLKQYQDDLGLDNVISVFIGLVGITVLSIVFVLAENFFHNYQHNINVSLPE